VTEGDAQQGDQIAGRQDQFRQAFVAGPTSELGCLIQIQWKSE
jgi:hypothetical protein